MNRTLDMILRNLRAEINRMEKQHEHDEVVIKGLIHKNMLLEKAEVEKNAKQ